MSSEIKIEKNASEVHQPDSPDDARQVIRSKKDLSGANLAGYVLNNLNASGAILRKTDLSGADLRTVYWSTPTSIGQTCIPQQFTTRCSWGATW